jgi:hypothetical protein
MSDFGDKDDTELRPVINVNEVTELAGDGGLDIGERQSI